MVPHSHSMILNMNDFLFEEYIFHSNSAFRIANVDLTMTVKKIEEI